MSSGMSESIEDAIGAIDDALDEAFSEDEDKPTPPKRSKPDYPVSLVA